MSWGIWPVLTPGMRYQHHLIGRFRRSMEALEAMLLVCALRFEIGELVRARWVAVRGSVTGAGPHTVEECRNSRETGADEGDADFGVAR
jgi:hypothetical protein